MFLYKLGLNAQWVDKVFQCVETVSYKLQMNGSIFESIRSYRGLRQGDPISSYLFILCQKWLSMNLRKLRAEKLVQGIRIARKAPMLNHLLFADDCLIFVNAELSQLDNLKKLLNDYEKLAGQKINFAKSKILGSRNIEENMMRLYGEFLGMRVFDEIPK